MKTGFSDKYNKSWVIRKKDYKTGLEIKRSDFDFQIFQAIFKMWKKAKIKYGGAGEPCPFNIYDLKYVQNLAKCLYWLN